MQLTSRTVLVYVCKAPGLILSTTREMKQRKTNQTNVNEIYKVD